MSRFLKNNKIEIYETISNREILKKLILYLKENEKLNIQKLENFLK